ncbi:MAG: hypothetical protein NTZ03_14095 [Actinobacteria bacterium]|nr:hypothetical protein [Actinomycetota bacterium]
MTAAAHATSAPDLAARLERVAALLGTPAEQLLDEWESLAPPAGSHAPQSVLTQPESKALARAGVRVAPVPQFSERASTSTLEQVLQMQLDGYTTSEVAQLLHLTDGRIRQRIASDQLFAVKGAAGEWRVPRWQFHGRHTIPGLPQVLAAMPQEWPPIAIERFLSQPSDDLIVDGESASPIEWLSEGLSPEPVAALARQLDIGL